MWQAYYDQMPQYQRSTNATQVFYETVLFPQSYRGFFILVVVLRIHLLLVLSITAGFAIRSRHTLLGNHWQSVAQLYSPHSKDLILESTNSTDREVRDRMRAKQMDNAGACIAPLGEDGQIGLTTVRNEMAYS